MDWTFAHVEQLTALHQKGLSYSRIGDEIGKTRNSCIGKARRLALPPRVNVAACERTPPRKAFVKAEPKPKPVTVNIVESGHKRCSLLELTDSTCRYPLWSLNSCERFYCGHPSAAVSEGRSYCARHAKICNTIR